MSIIAAGTTTTTALSSTGNTDGTLQFQVNGTTPSVTLNALGAVGVGAVPNFGTSGQALVSAGSTAAPTWTTIAASQWTTSGSNISYTAGQVQIGTGSAAAPALSVASDTNTGIFFPAADTIAFAEGGAEVARFDSSGNLGLGVTPSAWGTQRALDFAYGGLSIGTGLGVELVGNTFWNGTNWIYKGNGPSFRYEQDSAGHKWYNAPSGTAGNAISFTQQFAINNSGAIGVGSGNSTGTSGQVLTSAGSGAAPTWATPSAGAVTLISTATASNSASVSFTGLTTAYAYYFIEYDSLFASSAGPNFLMLVSSNNGSSYIGSGQYRWLNFYNALYGSGRIADGTGNEFVIAAQGNGMGNSANVPGSGVVNIFAPASNSCAFNWTTMNRNSAELDAQWGAGGLVTPAAVNAVRFQGGGGVTITGNFRLYGVAKT